MNRLWVRLTLAFVLVTLVGVSTVALLANLSASSQFRRYLVHNEMMGQGNLADDLAAYYERQGNWDGVEDVFEAMGGPMQPGRRGMGPMYRGGRGKP